jgi:hypothetical protein
VRDKHLGDGKRKRSTDEINDHYTIFGKNAPDVDYDGIGPCPFCGSRIDEFNFCACSGNLGVS